MFIEKKIIRHQRDLGRVGAPGTNKYVVKRLEEREAEGMGTMKKKTGDERTVSSLHCHMKPP